MIRFIQKEKGSTIFAVSIFAILLFTFMILFSIIVSKSTINLIIHEARSDLYLINRNAIFAIQHELMGEDIAKVDEEELRVLIKNGIKDTWNLDNRFQNGKGLIKSAQLKELVVLQEGEEDPVTSKISESLMIHTVVKIKIIPIIFSNILKDEYEFNIHGDIKIEKMETE